MFDILLITLYFRVDENEYIRIHKKIYSDIIPKSIDGEDLLGGYLKTHYNDKFGKVSMLGFKRDKFDVFQLNDEKLRDYLSRFVQQIGNISVHLIVTHATEILTIKKSISTDGNVKTYTNIACVEEETSDLRILIENNFNWK